MKLTPLGDRVVLKQLEAEYASIKKRHEKGKNAVSRKTSAKRKHYTICCRPHRTSRRNHSRTCTKYYFKKNSLTQKAETILPFRDIVTKSQYDFRFCYSFNYSFNISQNTLFKLKMSA